ncbi:MAG: PIN domain-containing protein, partial [Planctomycetota bacterium]|nr:PIN domain-containing protein [Planctomycetota bacterium]
MGMNGDEIRREGWRQGGEIPSTAPKTGEPKSFVLDTNVLWHNPDALFSFADNWVLLPIAVIEELDRFKTRNDELGRNARRVIRFLDSLRNRGRLGEGVSLPNGGRLQI